jgi:hypothetical protein
MKFVIFTILFLSLAFSECYRHRLIHHLKYKRHYNSMSLKDFTKLVETRFK